MKTPFVREKFIAEAPRHCVMESAFQRSAALQAGAEFSDKKNDHAYFSQQSEIGLMCVELLSEMGGGSFVEMLRRMCGAKDLTPTIILGGMVVYPPGFDSMFIKVDARAPGSATGFHRLTGYLVVNPPGRCDGLLQFRNDKTKKEVSIEPAFNKMVMVEAGPDIFTRISVPDDAERPLRILTVRYLTSEPPEGVTIVKAILQNEGGRYTSVK